VTFFVLALKSVILPDKERPSLNLTSTDSGKKTGICDVVLAPCAKVKRGLILTVKGLSNNPIKVSKLVTAIILNNCLIMIKLKRIVQILRFDPPCILKEEW
jgi:hypothetical protein